MPRFKCYYDTDFMDIYPSGIDFEPHYKIFSYEKGPGGGRGLSNWMTVEEAERMAIWILKNIGKREPKEEIKESKFRCINDILGLKTITAAELDKMSEEQLDKLEKEEN